MPRMKQAVTRQAQQVLNLLSTENCHMTAEEIQNALPDVGRATIYRALFSLERQRQIRRLALESGVAVYEFSRPQHMHFICENCGRIEDLPGNPGAEAMQSLEERGYLPQRADIMIYGICLKCLKNNKEEQSNV